MSKCRKRQQKDEPAVRAGDSVSCPTCYLTPKIAIPQPLTVRFEVSAEDNKRYAEERDCRQAQLAAQRLNWITAGGIAAAFLSLVGLYITLTQSRKQFAEDQRAWILPYETAPRETPDGRIYFDFLMKNTGKTPGLETRGIMTGTSDVTTIPSEDKDDRSHEAIIAPEAPYHLSTDQHPMNENDLLPNRAGKPFYLYGTIRYSDVFGKPHWLQFCDQTSGALKDYAPCPVHNRADTERE